MSSLDAKDEDGTFLVLRNSEEQYSLWPQGIKVPNGWLVVKKGTRASCGVYVSEVWTDMRPLSLRKRMEEEGKREGSD